MWPWISSRFDRAVNRKLLLRQLRSFVPMNAELPTVVTTVPVVADIVDEFPARSWVYYCVDDFSSWPGLDHSAIQALEEKLVARADVIVAVSATLRDRIARMGRESQLLSHGVDVEFWSQPIQPCPAAIADLPRPLVVFWGVIDRRMDTDLVRRLGERLSKGTIVLAGPLSDPDPALLRLPRVAAIGALPLDQLPALAATAAVLIMPYDDLPVTRAIQPLKLKEYLATGRPVVVRDLPANREWADCLDLVGNPDEFAEAVTRRLQSGLPNEQRLARGRLHRESWDMKARTFERWIHNNPTEVAKAC
jgi:glycosyltransferase involved in cell wall biosynthesis